MNKLKNCYAIIFPIVILLIIIIPTILSTFVSHRTLTNLQKSIFDKNRSILFSASIGFWPILMFLFLLLYFFFLYACICLSLAYKFPYIKKNLVANLKDGVPESPCTVSTIKFLLKFPVIICLIALISFPNYCIITSEKIYIRDLRTIFREVQYNLEDISQVELRSDSGSDGVVTLKYIISIGHFKVNLMNSKYYYSSEKAYENLSDIHTLIKLYNIPLHQNTKEIDYENSKILKKHFSFNKSNYSLCNGFIFKR